jgi:phosphoribosyl-ATP pyrophosphohydrolase/phosphoribosyl-AMP cyclohydrolase
VDVEDLWATLRPDSAGLVAAIVVHDGDDRVLMLGYMNREALAATLSRGRVTFWSRSRKTLWEKGETSGHGLELRELRVDCDGDALLVRADPRGPTCHTGASSCFFRPVVAAPEPGPGETSAWSIGEADDGPSRSALVETFATILARQRGEGMTQREGKSYVRSLLDHGVGRINEKIREEAEELCAALEDESDDRVASETADLLFHALVGLAHRGVDLGAIAKVLRARHGRSGIDEKASRQSS